MEDVCKTINIFRGDKIRRDGIVPPEIVVDVPVGAYEEGRPRGD